MSANFETRKFRDIEVVVNTADPERPINLTKLAASLTGSSQTFKRLIKHNKGFWAIIESYVASETAEDSVVPFGTTESHDLQKLFDKGVLVLVNGGSNKQAFGTYGPTWLADWIVKQFHELFEATCQEIELFQLIFIFKSVDPAMEVGQSSLKIYNVSEEKELSFVVEERQIGGQPFINYRSLEVKIGKRFYKPSNVGKGINLRLSEEIKGFLRDRENVVHLNLISQILNGWNYFEIWKDFRIGLMSDAKTGLLKSDFDMSGTAHVKTGLLKSDFDMSGTAHVKTGLLKSDFDIGQSPHVKSGLIGIHNMLLPNEVLKVAHEGISVEEPFDNEIAYYPIWRWEGSKKSPKSKHWIHFDILVYILSNVFVDFRKEFMTLLTVELQLSEVKNESLSQTKSLREAELEIEVEKLRGENDDLKTEIRRLNTNLERATARINVLNGQLVGARADVNRLNRNLASFTPLSASTHSISFILKLYISDLHPRRRAVRAKAVDGKIWVGVYCGEEANFTKTVRDVNARIVATFPVNSRDTLAYISTQLIGETVEEAHYKHWLVQGRDLPNLLDSITETLLNNDIIVGNVEVNHELLANLIEAEEPEEVVEAVVPDPIEPPRPEYNFAELARFEYYYKNRYRERREDTDVHRLYFHVGNAAARVREYVNPEAVLRLRRRRV